MGGCVTKDVEKLSDKHLFATITSNGVLALAQQGKFLDISPETISDKSKAGSFTKSLVCVQAVWFMFKCIVRIVEGYSLALLEIHTIVHIVCALAMYLLWWKVIFIINIPLSSTSLILNP